jgi:hypothetical protein
MRKKKKLMCHAWAFTGYVAHLQRKCMLAGPFLTSTCLVGRIKWAIGPTPYRPSVCHLVVIVALTSRRPKAHPTHPTVPIFCNRKPLACAHSGHAPAQTQISLIPNSQPDPEVPSKGSSTMEAFGGFFMDKKVARVENIFLEFLKR